MKQQTLINTVCIIAAPFTGGISLVGLAAPYVFGGSDDNNSNQIMESWKMQNEQWKAMMEANREEVKKLRDEREKKDNKIKHNNDEVAKLNAIINNPHSSEEEKRNAKKRIVLLEDDNKKLKKDLAKIAKDIEEKSKVPPAPSKPWSFPKLGFMDKALLAGGTVLLIYLLIPENKKK